MASRVACTRCGTYAEDDGKQTIVMCEKCDTMLVYREPMSEVCSYCMRKVHVGHYHNCMSKDGG